MQTKISMPRHMLQAATKRAYRAAGRSISWTEARRRGRAWCHAMLTGEPAWTWRKPVMETAA